VSDDFLYLTPGMQDQRLQRAAHTVLGAIYQQAHRDNLPSITWSIATTGVLNGSIDQHIPAEVARKIFDIWTRALGLEAKPDLSAGRALGHRGEVCVQLALPLDRGPWQSRRPCPSRAHPTRGENPGTPRVPGPVDRS
jgi:hypothetical protein